MKRYIHETENMLKLQVIVEVGFVKESESIAASYNKDQFKGSELPPAVKDALIDSQVLADYHAFVETLEDLITEV